MKQHSFLANDRETNNGKASIAGQQILSKGDRETTGRQTGRMDNSREKSGGRLKRADASQL
jgi:hypothetical protein